MGGCCTSGDGLVGEGQEGVTDSELYRIFSEWLEKTKQPTKMN